MKIKCIIKRPGRSPYSTAVENNLHNLQVNVGGYIEVIAPFKEFPDLLMIVNEEGKLDNLPANFYIRDLNDIIHGTAIFCGRRGDEFCDIPMSYFEFKQSFFNPRINDCNLELDVVKNLSGERSGEFYP